LTLTLNFGFDNDSHLWNWPRTGAFVFQNTSCSFKNTMKTLLSLDLFKKSVALFFSVACYCQRQGCPKSTVRRYCHHHNREESTSSHVPTEIIWGRCEWECTCWSVCYQARRPGPGWGKLMLNRGGENSWKICSIVEHISKDKTINLLWKTGL
jgi:hypothetical protein